MKFVIKLEKSPRQFDINFLRKIVSRINVLKISNPDLNKYLIELNNGEIIVKEASQLKSIPSSTFSILPESALSFSEIPQTELFQTFESNNDKTMNDVVKQAINFVMKNSQI